MPPGDYQEVTYEAYGPGGTGLVVFCLTDNLNRTASEVKPTMTKMGAKVRSGGGSGGRDSRGAVATAK